MPSAAEPAWIEVAAPTAAYSSFGQAQTTLGTVEPDMFWPSDVPRYPSLEQDTFFPQAKPPAEQEFLSRTAMNPTRLGAVLLGIGFFSVFVAQMSFELQLVLGAPVFEEFFKFGLALFLVSWIRTPPGHPARWAVILLRLVVAAAVGAGFGVLEHFFSYGDEGALLIWFRVLFHGGSCLLSMACYTILEAGPTRLLWASTFLSSVVHYANNVGAVPVGLLGTITSDTVPLTYTFGLTAVAYLLVAFVFIRPDLLRRLATRLGRSARLVA